MPSSLYSLLALCVCLPLWGACGDERSWLFVETQVQELCIVEVATDFPEATGSVSQVLGADQLGIDLNDAFSASMFLRGIGVSPLHGIDSVAFIDELRIEVSGGGQEPALLLDYAASEDSSDSLFVPSASAVDLALFLEADDLEFSIAFEGVLPKSAWAAHLEVCLSAQATYRESL